MYVACCCLPRCPESAGKAGILCARHLALVPAGIRKLLKARRGPDVSSSRRRYEAEVWAIREVLLELWEVAFPTPPGHVAFGLQRNVCTCPLCTEAGLTARRAREERRYRHQGREVQVDEAA